VSSQQKSLGFFFVAIYSALKALSKKALLKG